MIVIFVNSAIFYSQEWIGYICGVVVLLPALIVTFRATTLQYLQESDDGRMILLQNSHIIATGVSNLHSYIHKTLAT